MQAIKHPVMRVNDSGNCKSQFNKKDMSLNN